MLAGLLASSYEKTFRVVDVGPNAENKDEVLYSLKYYFRTSFLNSHLFLRYPFPQ